MNLENCKKLVAIEGFAHSNLFDNRLPIWESLNLVTDYLLHAKHEILSPVENVFIENPELVSIGKGCKIGPSVLIVGPCIIGDNTEIRHGAYVRPGTIIGSDCVIGHATEVVRSIIFDGARLPHFNYVGDSIIGRDVNMGAGSRIANVRLDGGDVSIALETGAVSTGRNKFGAIVGDGVSVGCNAVINPGTIISPRMFIKPGTVIGGCVS